MATRLHTLLTTVALGFSSALLASPAGAATSGDWASSARWSKSEAIIGQASALQAILAAQGGAVLPNRTPQPMSFSRAAPSTLSRLDRTGGKP